MKPWDFHFFVSTTNEMVLASRCSWPEAIDRAVQIEKYFAEQQQSSLESTHLLTSMLVKSPAGTFTRVAKHISLSRVFDAGIAVELYRRRHGRRTDGLNELVPEFLSDVPVDPFSGQPLKFTFGDGVFTVYSVGSNRVDDGGNGGSWGNEPDITCRICIVREAGSNGQGNE